MKITAFILLVFCMQVSATTLAQNVTLSEHNASLEKVINDIKQQTGYSFFYNQDWLKQSQPVDIVIKDTPLDKALELCFKDQPYDYAIINRTIVLKLKELPPKKKEFTRPNTVSGRVQNTQREHLAGASVIIKRTKSGTLTDADGRFAINGIKENDTLIISFVGYQKQFVPIDRDNDFIITLKEATNSLDQVVVQAYGKTSQRFNTGDIATVTSKEIENQPVMNPLLALQGRVAGVDVTQTSGYASAPVKVEIRGRGSVDPNQISDPLYIIDGVPLSVLEISGGSGNGTVSNGFLQNGHLIGPANGQSPLFNVNPSDIETITILKDADATSIYGSRGANGVIIITTKKGKTGKTIFNASADEGVTSVARYYQLLNTPQYLEMRREAFRNDGITPDASNAPDLVTWDQKRYTDWEKALYGKSGRVINSQLNLSGGNEQTTFRISGAYNHSEEITTANGADQRGSVAFNLTHSSLNRKFTVSFSSTYSFTQSDMISFPGNDMYAPNAPPIYNADGTLNWEDWRPIGGNPFGSLLQTYTSKTDFLNSNLQLSYELFKGLTFKSNFGYNNAQANQTQLIPIASQDPAGSPTGLAQFGYNSNKNWIIEPQISYEAVLGKGKLTALVGGSVQETSTDGIFIAGGGYTSDVLLRTISNAPFQSSKDIYGRYRYASVFARANYNLEDKYILNLSGRRDGSSNYGPGNQYGNFASIGAAWLFTEESWFKNHPSFLSFGKLRGSYGLTGSDGGQPYAYITRWSSGNLNTYDGVVPLVATQHANPDYKWQQNLKLEAGLDLGFFKDFITVSAVYYRNRTGNQLLAYPTTLISGFNSVLDNLPATVQNAGYEFTLGGKGVHIHSKYFNWDWAPNFNFTINQNKFLSFRGQSVNDYVQQGLVGKPLNGRYILHYTGVDPQTGQYTYQDMNHDGYINSNYGPAGDVYFKKTSPSFSTNFGSNFDIMGFNISLFFILKKQTGVNILAQGSQPGIFNVNQPIAVLSRWQKPGDITTVGKFSTIGNADPNGYLGSSDIGYTDASFIRLKTLSLSYNIPEKLAKRIGFTGKLFFNTDNLFTITSYKGLDPETQIYNGLPPVKTVVLGLSLNFN